MARKKVRTTASSAIDLRKNDLVLRDTFLHKSKDQTKRAKRLR